mmetsp:Transcript_21435/g.48551  ORF Transcript_21435/g.48551 Transcript_21435/m.48551 type:complete len:253 (+) Transcript_21435:1338-2096(+)
MVPLVPPPDSEAAGREAAAWGREEQRRDKRPGGRGGGGGGGRQHFDAVVKVSIVILTATSENSSSTCEGSEKRSRPRHGFCLLPSILLHHVSLHAPQHPLAVEPSDGKNVFSFSLRSSSHHHCCQAFPRVSHARTRPPCVLLHVVDFHACKPLPPVESSHDEKFLSHGHQRRVAPGFQHRADPHPPSSTLFPPVQSLAAPQSLPPVVASDGVKEAVELSDREPRPSLQHLRLLAPLRDQRRRPFLRTRETFN